MFRAWTATNSRRSCGRPEKLVSPVPEVVWEHPLAHRLLDDDVLR